MVPFISKKIKYFISLLFSLLYKILGMINIGDVMKNIFLFIVLLNFLLLGADDDTETIEVRSDNNFPPYEYAEDDISVGFNIEIMYAATEAIGLEVNHRSDKWEVLRDGIENRNINMLTGMFQSEERESTVDFSTPILTLSHSIFVIDGSDITGLDDARGKKILVQKRDITWDYLIENNITDNIIEVENKEDALLLLSSGQYDAALLSRVNAYYLMNKHGIDNVKEVGSEIFKGNLCFAVPDGDSDLLIQINEGLAIIKENGTYDEIYDKWFGFYEKDLISKQVIRTLFYILIPIVIIIIFIVLWSTSLKRQVNKKTIEIKNMNENLEKIIKERTDELEHAYIEILENERRALVSELVLGMAHEMNTPVGNILTLNTYQYDLLQKLIVKRDTDILTKEDFDTYLVKITTSDTEINNSLKKIIELISLFKSLDVNSLNQRSTFNIKKLLESVIVIYKSRHHTNLNFIIDCKDIELYSFKEALFNVIYCLIDNAVVHGLKDGSGEINVEYSSENNRNFLLVSDNGTGMSEETLAQVFNYFYSKDKRTGTGLGLNKVKHLVELVLEGIIEVESEVEVGTFIKVNW